MGFQLAIIGTDVGSGLYIYNYKVKNGNLKTQSFLFLVKIGRTANVKNLLRYSLKLN